MALEDTEPGASFGGLDDVFFASHFLALLATVSQQSVLVFVPLLSAILQHVLSVSMTVHM